MKLNFREALQKNGKIALAVGNDKDERLGYISYYENWKCYVWEQNNGIIMSGDCLEQVIDYMKRLDK
jgi:hypothetical protein